MKVCIIGAGAIGGWIAAKLGAQGHQVVALTSRGPLDSILLTEGGSTETIRLSPFKGSAELLVIAVNFAVDLLYAKLDPRIRLR